MKKIAIILIILVVTYVAFAAPGDVVLTITIPAAKVVEFRAGFLREHPVPIQHVVDANGIPVLDVNDMYIYEPQYTEKQWFKRVILRYVNSEVKHGNDKIAKENANNDGAIAQ